MSNPLEFPVDVEVFPGSVQGQGSGYAGWFIRGRRDKDRFERLVIYDRDGTELAEWDLPAPGIVCTFEGQPLPTIHHPMEDLFEMEDRATRLTEQLDQPGRPREQALRELGVRKLSQEGNR